MSRPHSSTTLRHDDPQLHREGLRDVEAVLSPLDEMAADSLHLIAIHGAQIEAGGRITNLPRYLFTGPQGGDKPIRIGLFAGIHGDEPEGVHALVEFVNYLEADPALAAGFSLWIYPVCNPDGFAHKRRTLASGKDLDLEFWKDSVDPEVKLLEADLLSQSFQGLISLRTDATSDGFYASTRGATFTKHLIEPALKAAEKLLPRNINTVIGGFSARNGVVRSVHEGALSAPPGARPRPFEITLATPKDLPEYEKQSAFILALHAILAEYRRFIAYAPNL